MVGGLEGGERIADRIELLPDIPAIIGCGDCLHNGEIVKLLRIVEFVTTRIARRVEMPDVVDVRPDRADDDTPKQLSICFWVEFLVFIFKRYCTRLRTFA